MNSVLIENEVLTRQLAQLQSRASAIIAQRSAEIEQLNHVIEFLSAELRCQRCRVRLLEIKIDAFRTLQGEGGSRGLAA